MIRNLINLGGILLEWYIACSLYDALHPRRFSKKTSLLLGALCVAVQFTGNALFLGKSSTSATILVIGVSFVFGFLLALLYVSKWYWKVLESALLIVLHASVEIAFAMLLQLILHIDLAIAESNMVIFAIATFTCKFIALVIAHLIRLRMLRKKAAASKAVVLPMLLFPIGSVLVFTLIIRTCFVLQDLPFIIITIVSMISLIAANIILLRVIEQQSDYIRTKEALRFAKAQLQLQVEHYDALYRYQTETRKMRHDEKNKLLALSGLLRSGNADAAASIIDRELDLNEQEEESVIDTGNPVIDAVLQSKQSVAQENGVQLLIHAKTEEPILIDTIKLGVLLGNAVDNAVEAVAKITDPAVIRTVSVTLQTRMHRIFVCVENPTAEKGGNTDDLRSDKDDAVYHGYGLQSIRTVAAEYDGSVTIVWEDHRFRIEVGLANQA